MIRSTVLQYMYVKFTCSIKLEHVSHMYTLNIQYMYVKFTCSIKLEHVSHMYTLNVLQLFFTFGSLPFKILAA